MKVCWAEMLKRVVLESEVVRDYRVVKVSRLDVLRFLPVVC
jgi:hypothetical protein